MDRILKLAAGAAAISLIATGGAFAQDTQEKSGKSIFSIFKGKGGSKSATATGSAATVTANSATIGGKPNLNGVWQVVGSANWNLEPHDAATAPVYEVERHYGAWGAIPAGVGVVKEGTIPYLPAALEQRNKNREQGIKGDNEAACYLPGIPRATYMDHAFQIVQGEKGDILIAYEYASANRVIYMKDEEVPPIDTWMGTSYGSWEGDTLKVVTLAQNGRTWLDRSGNYLSPTAKVTERFKPNGRNHIDYEATIEDPEVYSKPWTISMPLYRRMEPNAQLLEFKCVPFAERFLYGDLEPNPPAGK